MPLPAVGIYGFDIVVFMKKFSDALCSKYNMDCIYMVESQNYLSSGKDYIEQFCDFLSTIVHIHL